eukprot:TRINITY_DN15133_c0_g1_i1.p1 TRINITY_DN15133_c0_g1~~TRINITY_DN15133_c0_g1_i1.p1  ORF type:complete len:243 (-),score=28.67 TRINITY_DN15133_c0_g1_i1:680-1408(-)
MAEVATAFIRSDLSVHSLLMTDFRQPFVAVGDNSFMSRKRAFESFQLTGSTSSIGEKTFESAPQTPELVAPEDAGLPQFADESDSDVGTAPSTPVEARHPQQPFRDVPATADVCEPLQDDTPEIFRAASLLFRLWADARQSPSLSSSKRIKIVKNVRDEEAYVPKAAAIRRTKKHVNKDVRIPNSCEVHKKRHLKCPMDCPERKKREAEQRLLDMMQNERSGDGEVEATGSGSDIEADGIDA